MLIVIILLIIGALFIVREQRTNFKDVSSTILFSKVYLKWIWQISINVKEIIVYASHMDWTPELVSSSKPIPVVNQTLNATQP